MENNSPDFYQIADVAELKKMLEEHTGIILYFYNDDCQPCISLRPKVETMIAERYPQMKLIYINSKAHPAIPASFNVFANPTLLIFFAGKEFRRFSKYVGIPELSDTIDRYYRLAF